MKPLIIKPSPRLTRFFCKRIDDVSARICIDRREFINSIIEAHPDLELTDSKVVNEALITLEDILNHGIVDYLSLHRRHCLHHVTRADALPVEDDDAYQLFREQVSTNPISLMYVGKQLVKQHIEVHRGIGEELRGLLPVRAETEAIKRRA